MTTPPLTRHPHNPPGPYPGNAPHPHPAPPRPRRARIVAMVVTLTLLLTAAAATAWRLSRDDDGSPLAGRPRVNDTRAGLTYAIPKGWEHDEAKDKDLISGFTSQITSRTEQDSETGKTVLAGRAPQVIRPSGLQRQAESAARSNAEFFFPDQAATLEESRPATVSSHPAHTVTLNVKEEDGGTAQLMMTLITVDDNRTSFLLGVTTNTPGTNAGHDIEAVMESARTT
ncbi:hypothetical protein OHS70_37380 [Streptomyces sp. NBC_00390]|uniref:hypothetical protein n=1 Tax=Streptomyces sp. NBC_00390 TaxID=2975736 RepID=UPI002E1E1740